MTAFAVAGVCWYLAANEMHIDDAFTHNPSNPLLYVLNAVFHQDWAHFYGNMRLWIPFGVVLTRLTSNRHLLVVAPTAHVMASVGRWWDLDGTVRSSTGLNLGSRTFETRQAWPVSHP